VTLRNPQKAGYYRLTERRRGNPDDACFLRGYDTTCVRGSMAKILNNRTDRLRPVTLLPAIPADGPPTAVRVLDSNSISHEKLSVVLGNALLSGLPALKLNETKTNPVV
jgi:hypothetical protein